MSASVMFPPFIPPSGDVDVVGPVEGTRLYISGDILEASTGTENLAIIAGEINQSGDASYNGLFIDIVETATGSGTKKLINARVDGDTKFEVDNAGVITASADIESGHIFGKVRTIAGAGGFEDYAILGHVDRSTYQTSMLWQAPEGAAAVNSLTGQDVGFSIDGTVQWFVDADQSGALCAVGGKNIGRSGSRVGSVFGTVADFGADTDSTHFLGRLRVSSALATDNAYLSHYDQTASGDGWIRFNNAGEVAINVKTGQILDLKVNGSGMWQMGASIIPVSAGTQNLGANTANGRIDNIFCSTLDGVTATFNSDVDSTHIFGRAKIHSSASDAAMFSHFDHASTTAYAVKHESDGRTTINGSNLISFAMGGSTIASWSSTGALTLSGSTPDISIVGYTTAAERSTPSAPAANRATWYAKDNGSGKTQFVVMFSDGAEHVLATMA